MRHLIVFCVVLFSCCVSAQAQRPWLFASNPEFASTPRFALAANQLHLFDNVLLSSASQGRSWQTATTIPPNVVAVADFFANLTLALSQESPGAVAKVYFTQNGTSWSFSEDLDLGGKTVVSLGAIGEAFYVYTREGMVYIRGEEIDSLPMMLPAGTDVHDVVTNDEYLAATTSNGIYLSTDKGARWFSSNPPGVPQTGFTVHNLELYNNRVLCPTPAGVYAYSSPLDEWTSVGRWMDSPTPPAVLAITAQSRWRLAIVRNAAGRHQMYRLETGDTVWRETAYQVAIPNPSVTPHMLKIDAGWAVLYQTSSTDADSNGVYIYDLNDFTSVEQEQFSADVSIEQTETGFIVHHNRPHVSVSVYSLLGSEIARRENLVSGSEMPLPDTRLGPIAIVVRHNNLVANKLILR